jgi:hypothetical protein
MLNGFAGCIHFTPVQFDVKILIFLYIPEKNPTTGSFRTTRTATWIDCVDGIQQSKDQQMGQRAESSSSLDHEAMAAARRRTETDDKNGPAEPTGNELVDGPTEHGQYAETRRRWREDV